MRPKPASFPWTIVSGVYHPPTNKVKVKVAQLRLTLCDPMDYTIHGILQARILEWVAFPFSRGSSQPRDRTQVFCIAGGLFNQLSHQGSPRILEWVSYLLQRIFPTQESNRGLLHCRQILLPTELSGKPHQTKQSLKYSFEEQIAPKPTFNPTNMHSSLKTPRNSPPPPPPPAYLHLLSPCLGGGYWYPSWSWAGQWAAAQALG